MQDNKGMNKQNAPIPIEYIQIALLILMVLFLFVSMTLVYATYITGFVISVVIMATINRTIRKTAPLKTIVAFEALSFVLSVFWFATAIVALYTGIKEVA
jgi:hypothetical protein